MGINQKLDEVLSNFKKDLMIPTRISMSRETFYYIATGYREQSDKEINLTTSNSLFYGIPVQTETGLKYGLIRCYFEHDEDSMMQEYQLGE